MNFQLKFYGIVFRLSLFKCSQNLGRSHDASVNESEPKARTDCNESSQSKECSVAVKSQQKVQSHSASAAATTSTAGHKLRQGQHSHHHHHPQQQQHQKSTVLRRKVNVTKKQPAKQAAATPKPQQQVINRARGTLHGLSTIKRHGNVRVT